MTITTKKSPTLSKFGDSEREAIGVVRGIKKPSLLYPILSKRGYKSNENNE